MLMTVRNRLGGIVDVPNLLRGAGPEDDPCEDGATSIGSVIRDSMSSWGSSYHSESGAEEDQLEEYEVYIDLGEDDLSERDEALRGLVQSAKDNGLNAVESERLSANIAKKSLLSNSAGKIPPRQYDSHEGTY